MLMAYRESDGGNTQTPDERRAEMNRLLLIVDRLSLEPCDPTELLSTSIRNKSQGEVLMSTQFPVKLPCPHGCRDGWIAVDYHWPVLKAGGTDVRRCVCNPKQVTR